MPNPLPELHLPRKATDDQLALQQRVADLEASVRANATENRLSIVVHSGEFDKLMAALTLATGAATMGTKVHLFFTFWATTALRKPNGKRKAGGFFERLMRWMLPRGRGQAKLGKMHFAGAGTALMKRRMKGKNLMGLDELFAAAEALEVRISACETSLDLMGFDLDDLVDYPNLDVCGVATFMESAMVSRTTLYI